MTSRDTTRLLPLKDGGTGEAGNARWSDVLYCCAFGAIGWPFLLYSLWGGTMASKRHLLARIGLAEDALPNLGSWKADTGLLHRIVDAVEEIRPRNVVELGAGATSLVCAKALEMNGGGTLHSFDQHAGFVEATAGWLRDEGVDARMHHAPLVPSPAGWPGKWYHLRDVPDTIDLLIIDGPPWAIHPFVRGAAEVLFDRLAPGGVVLLDDASRPGERVVARRWSENWPDMHFERMGGSTKGTLIGRKAAEKAQIISMPVRKRPAVTSPWRRAAAIAGVFAIGWTANEISGDFAAPAHAASFIDEADASYSASLTRQRMQSQIESTLLDRKEIVEATGLDLPVFPAEWKLSDVQVYPSDLGMAVVTVMTTDEGETVSLFATRAETPAEALPLIEQRERRSLAYWEVGPFAYALTGELEPQRMLSLAAELAES